MHALLHVLQVLHVLQQAQTHTCLTRLPLQDFKRVARHICGFDNVKGICTIIDGDTKLPKEVLWHVSYGLTVACQGWQALD